MSFKLPDHVELSTETLCAIADRHDVDSSIVERLPETGIFNAIYRLGHDAILRIPRNHPKFVEAARHEAVAVPAARAAGVRTPCLLAFDDTLDLLPVPSALDFAGVPLRAVPHMLAGHREVALLDGDATVEARILWRHLQLSIWTLPRGAVPGRSWGERPLPMLLEVLRFFMAPPDDRWRDVGPVASRRQPLSLLVTSGGAASYA